MVVREIMEDGNVRVFAKYRIHHKRSNGREYTYHSFEAQFDNKVYEASSSKSEAAAKSMLTAKLRVPIRNQTNGPLAKATPDKDKHGALTENATVTA